MHLCVLLKGIFDKKKNKYIKDKQIIIFINICFIQIQFYFFSIFKIIIIISMP